MASVPVVRHTQPQPSLRPRPHPAVVRSPPAHPRPAPPVQRPPRPQRPGTDVAAAVGTKVDTRA